MDKYENRLPKAYEQKVNKFIKEVAREAGITEKIEVSEMRLGEDPHGTSERGNEHVSGGSTTIAIMKITGNKTEKKFTKYIKITEEQTAMELMNNPYFRADNS